MILKELYPDINFIFLDEIDSTNTYCRNLTLDDFNNMTVVISDVQKDGRGTKGRRWSSPKGKSLLFSILLKPKILISDLSFIPILTSVALNDTFKAFNINTYIKWPNDIILDNKKLCGILTESKIINNKLDYIIIGIGINVNVEKEDFSNDLKPIATSLKISTGNTYDKNEILIKFISIFEENYNELLNNNKAIILNKYKANSFILNKKVSLVSRYNSEIVTPIDILEDGSLLVKDIYNNKRNIVSGEVSLRF